MRLFNLNFKDVVKRSSPSPVDVEAELRAMQSSVLAQHNRMLEALIDERTSQPESQSQSPLIERGPKGSLPASPPYRDTDAPIPAIGAPQYPPNIQDSHGVYKWDWPYKYTIPQAPVRHPDSKVSVEMLRVFADTYDVLRSCILQLKREVISVPIKIVARDTKNKHDPKIQKRIAKAEEFFKRRGGLGGPTERREIFEGKMIEDLCIVGASAIHLHRTRGGQLHQAVAIDASTIRPRVNAWGWPGPGEEYWEQWVQGVKVAGFTQDELWYEGLAVHARSWTPFFASPVEWLIGAIMSALKADEWNRTWLTDGNIPDLLLGAPPDWTVDQIIQFSAYFDAMLSGDAAGRHKAKLVPGGFTQPFNYSRKDQDFQQFELWLLRRCCAIMGVQPASLGYAGEEYHVNQADSRKSTTMFGVGMLLLFRKNVYDDILDENGYSDLQTENVEQLNEDPKERAERNQILGEAGIKTINESREEEGLEPIEYGDIPLIQSFYVPLEQVANPPPPQPDPSQGAQGAPPGGAPDQSQQAYPGGAVAPPDSDVGGLLPPGQQQQPDQSSAGGLLPPDQQQQQQPVYPGGSATPPLPGEA